MSKTLVFFGIFTLCLSALPDTSPWWVLPVAFIVIGNLAVVLKNALEIPNLWLLLRSYEELNIERR